MNIWYDIGAIAAQCLLALPLIAVDALRAHPPAVFDIVVMILGYCSLVVAILNLIPASGRAAAMRIRARVAPR